MLTNTDTLHCRARAGKPGDASASLVQVQIKQMPVYHSKFSDYGLEKSAVMLRVPLRTVNVSGIRN